MKKQTRTIFRKRIITLCIVVCILIILSLISVYMSYNYLKRNVYHVPTDKFSEPVTLVVISDLHGHAFGEDNQKLVSLIAEQKPDLVIMAGDMVNNVSDDAEVAVSLVEQLAELAPVYFALGNHELDYIKVRDAELVQKLEKAGADVLELAWQDIEVNGQDIRIGGMYDYAFALDGFDSTNPETMKPEVYQFLTGFLDTGSEDVFTLMISHRPESFVLGQASVSWDIDLVVSGHDHGGQVVLPVLGGLWAGDQGWFPDYAHGLHEKDLLRIFITSGLGSQLQKLPRLNNLPEVAVLKLEPQ